ncbi:MAG: peptidyl-prolyl cis-trans isomerase [Planctomycetes bacterium]|nr:peptidyl-prolyl cis-trans isomerase [Planctomycetota bacterium]
MKVHASLVLSVCLLLTRTVAVSAAETSTDPEKLPVAMVNGQPVTLRAVEDALLRREGAEKIEEWVHGELDRIEWSRLSDDQPLLAIGSDTLTRKDLALALLKSGTCGKVRDELISIAMVEQALVKEGITVDSAAIDATYAAMERQFERDAAAKHKERIDFASYLRASEQKTPEQFKQQPGFRLLAGLRVLVLKQARTEIAEADLKAWFEGRRESYDQAEAVQLSDIFVAYQVHKGPDGKDRVDPDEPDRVLIDGMMPLYRAIKEGQQSFEQTWQVYGKGYDRDAGAGGALGWVTRNGVRSRPGARPVPAEAMEKAFAAKEFPSLIVPVKGPGGVDLLRVEAHRPAKAADFAEVKERVLCDLVETQVDERTTRMLADLRRASDVRYESLPEVIERRGK